MKNEMKSKIGDLPIGGWFGEVLRPTSLINVIFFGREGKKVIVEEKKERT